MPSNDVTKNKIAIGDLVTLDSSMLRNSDGKVPYQNVWFFKFCDMFDDILEKVRFIELRPKWKEDEASFQHLKLILLLL